MRLLGLLALTFGAACTIERSPALREFACEKGGPCAPDALAPDALGIDASADAGLSSDAAAALDAEGLDAAAVAPDVEIAIDGSEPDAGAARDAAAPDAEIGAPDFQIDFVSASLAADGINMVVTVTLCNRGTLGLDAATYRPRLVLSRDGILDPLDVPLTDTSTWSFAALAIGGCRTKSSDPIAVPQVAGAFRVIALADPDDQFAETDEGNNQYESSSQEIGPDLVVTFVDGGYGATSLDLSATVCNRGTTRANPTHAIGYLSTDLVITPADPAIVAPFAWRFGPLAPNGCMTAGVAVSPSSISATGLFSFAAVIDAEGMIEELDENNNTLFASSSLGVGPDVTISSVRVVSTDAATREIEIEGSMCNQGYAPFSSANARMVLSMNTIVDATDQELAPTFPFVSPTPGQCSTVVRRLPLPVVAAGRYYVGIVADYDGRVGEIDETNNTRFSAAFDLGPDLVVRNLMAYKIATRVEISWQVCNDGMAEAMTTSTRFLLSSDQSVGLGDTQLADRGTSPLSPGGCYGALMDQFSLPTMPPGAYFVLGVADYGDRLRELDESNNVASAGTITLP